MVNSRIAILANGRRGTEVPAYLQELVSPGYIAEAFTTAGSHLPDTPYSSLVCDAMFLDAAIGAANAGVDAVLIASFPDYGIRAIRSALSVPVVGAGESALKAASLLGRRFSIVSVWPSCFNIMYREHLHRNDLTDQCASIRYLSDSSEMAKVGTSESVSQRIGRQEDTILAAVVDACQQAVAEDGADTIVLGCSCMSAAQPRIANACAFPIVDGTRLGYLAAETLLKTGLLQSPLAYPTPPLIAARPVAKSSEEIGPKTTECSICDRLGLG